MNDEVNKLMTSKVIKSLMKVKLNVVMIGSKMKTKRTKQMTFMLASNLYHGKKLHYFLMIIVYKRDLDTERVVQRKTMKILKRL